MQGLRHLLHHPLPNEVVETSQSHFQQCEALNLMLVVQLTLKRLHIPPKIWLHISARSKRRPWCRSQSNSSPALQGNLDRRSQTDLASTRRRRDVTEYPPQSVVCRRGVASLIGGKQVAQWSVNMSPLITFFILPANCTVLLGQFTFCSS